MSIRFIIPAIVFLSFSVQACQPDSRRPVVSWTDITPGTGLSATGIQIFEGRDDEIPIRAWYALADISSDGIEVRVTVSSDEDGKESTSSLSAASGACVSVNAGYYTIQEDVAKQIGLLVTDHQIQRNAMTGLFRDDKRLAVARSAIGFLEDGRPEIKWVISRNDSVFAWDSPPRPSGAPDAFALDDSSATYWPVGYAAAAGPSLVREGSIQITTTEELFGQSTIPNVHPRSAAGITENGELILLVVDGRQFDSRGVDLIDLATILLDLGAESAVNLDGGGSSSFVVNGSLLNKPEGGTTEREIVSAISVMCGD